MLLLVRRDARLRALERSVAEKGFQTVLVLRLAPLLPVPIGAYNYIYGATSMRFAAFAPAMFLGSLKPYAFDSYLGVFGRQVVNDVANTNSRRSASVRGHNTHVFSFAPSLSLSLSL